MAVRAPILNPPCRGGRAHGTAPDGPRTVPVRSAWPGAKGPSFCSRPQRAEVLRTGTVRDPGHFRDAPKTVGAPTLALPKAQICMKKTGTKPAGLSFT